jgi:hypothetical protein
VAGSWWAWIDGGDNDLSEVLMLECLRCCAPVSYHFVATVLHFGAGRASWTSNTVADAFGIDCCVATLTSSLQSAQIARKQIRLLVCRMGSPHNSHLPMAPQCRVNAQAF